MYTTNQLQKLWRKYHKEVHPNPIVPCDANPGDTCSVPHFLKWLDKQARLLRAEEKRKAAVIARIKPLGG